MNSASRRSARPRESVLRCFRAFTRSFRGCKSDPQLDPRHEISRWTGQHKSPNLLRITLQKQRDYSKISGIPNLYRSYGPEGRGFESLTAYQKTLDFRTEIKGFLCDSCVCAAAFFCGKRRTAGSGRRPPATSQPFAPPAWPPQPPSPQPWPRRLCAAPDRS